MDAQALVYTLGVGVLSFFLARLIKQMDENTKEVQAMRLDLALVKTELSNQKKSNRILKRAFDAIDRHLLKQGIVIPYEQHPNSEIDDE